MKSATSIVKPKSWFHLSHGDLKALLSLFFTAPSVSSITAYLLTWFRIIGNHHLRHSGSMIKRVNHAWTGDGSWEPQTAPWIYRAWIYMERKWTLPTHKDTLESIRNPKPWGSHCKVLPGPFPCPALGVVAFDSDNTGCAQPELLSSAELAVGKVVHWRTLPEYSNGCPTSGEEQIPGVLWMEEQDQVIKVTGRQTSHLCENLLVTELFSLGMDPSRGMNFLPLQITVS